MVLTFRKKSCIRCLQSLNTSKLSSCIWMEDKSWRVKEDNCQVDWYSDTLKRLLHSSERIQYVHLITCTYIRHKCTQTSLSRSMSMYWNKTPVYTYNCLNPYAKKRFWWYPSKIYLYISCLFNVEMDSNICQLKVILLG